MELNTTLKFLKIITIVPCFSTELCKGKPLKYKLTKNSVGNRKSSLFFDPVLKLQHQNSLYFYCYVIVVNRSLLIIQPAVTRINDVNSKFNAIFRNFFISNRYVINPLLNFSSLNGSSAHQALTLKKKSSKSVRYKTSDRNVQGNRFTF